MSELTDEVVNEEVVTEPTATESTPEENKEEQADPLLDALSSDDDSPVEPETEDEPSKDEPVDETEEEQPKGDDPVKPKSENRFQKLANENRELRERIEKINSETYTPQTVEELQEEGLSPELAEVRNLKQQLEVQNFNNQVYEVQTALGQESQKVIQDFPMFNPDSEEYDEEIAQQAAGLLESNLDRDPNTGQIIGYRSSPYQIYKPIADAYTKSQIQGQIKGQKANKRMLASVDAPSSATPRETKKDPLLEILKSDD